MKTLIKLVIVCAFTTLLALVVAGCATKKVDWNARVGVYPYDQAVVDFGPPDRLTSLSDGKKVAEWFHPESNSGASVGFGFGSFGSHSAVGVGVSQPIGGGYSVKVMRLTFGPDNKLVTWYKNY